MIEAIRAMLAECEDCSMTYQNVPVTDWSTRIQSVVQSSLLADSTINYVVPIYDGMSQFVEPAITLTGPLQAYQQSAGFGDVPPAPIQRWDSEIEGVSSLSTDPNDPNWYGNAKSLTFLPRTLNDLATQFPPDTLTVRFTADDARPGTFQLVSIQPTPR